MNTPSEAHTITLSKKSCQPINAMEWPPRSPDLTPCDFWLPGYLKSKVYDPVLATMQQLTEVDFAGMPANPQEHGGGCCAGNVQQSQRVCAERSSHGGQTLGSVTFR